MVSTYPFETCWSESQLGWWHSQVNGNIKTMFQTTNQFLAADLFDSFSDFHQFPSKKKRQKNTEFCSLLSHWWPSSGRYSSASRGPCPRPVLQSAPPSNGWGTRPERTMGAPDATSGAPVDWCRCHQSKNGEGIYIYIYCIYTYIYIYIYIHICRYMGKF